jgi:2-C-methyl-D-erythritol 2,4-cyclodiphosphate synthase
MALLASVNALIGEENFQVVNVDVTVVCERPRIGPHAEAMRARLADVLGIAPANVSIKGKSNEGMGWIGRGEGLGALAVALVARMNG